MKTLLMLTVEVPNTFHHTIARGHGYEITHLEPPNAFVGGSQMPAIPCVDEITGQEYDAVCVEHPALAIRLLAAGFTVACFQSDTNGLPLRLHRYEIDWKRFNALDLIHHGHQA
jgi:hypothetical protein